MDGVQTDDLGESKRPCLDAGFPASPIYFFAAAFFFRHSAHRFRVAAAMRFRPAALILRRGCFASFTAANF
jgi:hypothetical protein